MSRTCCSLLLCLLLLFPAGSFAEDILLSRAKSGDWEAAVTYAEQLIKKGDVQGAEAWLKRAAQQRYAPAALRLSKLYADVPSLAETEQTSASLHAYAITLLRAEAARGDGLAASQLGDIYSKTGQKEEATAWYEKAILLGEPKAKLAIARMALWGNMPHYQYEDALRLLKEAASAGSASAALELGLAYSGMYGGMVIPEAAFAAFSQGAARENEQAMYQLGLCYLGGIGTKQDTPTGRRLIKEAAEAGYALASYRYGQLLQNGVGGIQDSYAAIDWIERAANQGVSEALYALGVAYRDGKDVYQDKRKALDYFARAKAKYHVFATREYERLKD